MNLSQERSPTDSAIGVNTASGLSTEKIMLHDNSSTQGSHLPQSLPPKGREDAQKQLEDELRSSKMSLAMQYITVPPSLINKRGQTQQAARGAPKPDQLNTI